MNNIFKGLSRGIEQQVMIAMQDTGEAICNGMKDRLTKAGHIDTGALRDSIRSETVKNGNEIVTLIYADAKSPEGVQYAEFIELGSGAAHGREGGRVGTWRYKDRNGKWHTTDGMDADPFIEPSVEDNIPLLGVHLKERLYDIAKYARYKESMI